MEGERKEEKCKMEKRKWKYGTNEVGRRDETKRKECKEMRRRNRQKESSEENDETNEEMMEELQVTMVVLSEENKKRNEE